MYQEIIKNRKKDNQYYLKRNMINHKFSKIMYLSCLKINKNKYELTALIDYIFVSNNYKTMFPIKIIIDYETYLKINKIKFGIWLKYNPNIFNFRYLYIYQNLNTKKLIYKITKNDNCLNNEMINQYNHQLTYKARLDNNYVVEYLR